MTKILRAYLPCHISTANLWNYWTGTPLQLRWLTGVVFLFFFLSAVFHSVILSCSHLIRYLLLLLQTDNEPDDITHSGLMCQECKDVCVSIWGFERKYPNWKLSDLMAGCCFGWVVAHLLTQRIALSISKLRCRGFMPKYNKTFFLKPT